MGTKDNDRWTNYSIVVISFIALSSFCVVSIITIF